VLVSPTLCLLLIVFLLVHQPLLNGHTGLRPMCPLPLVAKEFTFGLATLEFDFMAHALFFGLVKFPHGDEAVRDGFLAMRRGDRMIQVILLLSVLCES
jgi:hypothetical protein